MSQTFKVLSALLSYPTPEMKAAAPEMRAVLDSEGLLPDKQRASVERLIGEIETRDIYDLQERYVLLFDRTRSLSLHLFEHVYGESRDRGSAMVDLAQAYEQHGLMIAANELPDFLPLFLEFLSALPPEEARNWLGQTVHIIGAFPPAAAQAEKPLRGGVLGRWRRWRTPSPTRTRSNRCASRRTTTPTTLRRSTARLGGRAGHLRPGRCRE